MGTVSKVALDRCCLFFFCFADSSFDTIIQGRPFLSSFWLLLTGRLVNMNPSCCSQRDPNRVQPVSVSLNIQHLLRLSSFTAPPHLCSATLQTKQGANNVCKHAWHGWIKHYTNSISRCRSHLRPEGVWGPVRSNQMKTESTCERGPHRTFLLGGGSICNQTLRDATLPNGCTRWK